MRTFNILDPLRRMKNRVEKVFNWIFFCLICLTHSSARVWLIKSERSNFKLFGEKTTNFTVKWRKFRIWSEFLPRKIVSKLSKKTLFCEGGVSWRQLVKKRRFIANFSYSYLYTSHSQVIRVAYREVTDFFFLIFMFSSFTSHSFSTFYFVQSERVSLE